MKIANPVLPGFEADPSMIRVGDTYYIANSTFEWWPGVRLHESQDMVHWRLLPSPLNRTSQLDMRGNPSGGGVWAPDLSYADGRFWLVYADVKVVNGAFKDCTNYLVTAEDIRGPWSDPIRINGVGFDASLFHDADGRKYLVQQTWDFREYRHSFDGITLTEFDTATMALMPHTERTLWSGTDVRLVEGPHLYAIDGYYYLFAAEGGTVWTHQEVVARSRTLEAHSFEAMPSNPLLTNFDTPRSYLQKQGHGSLVNTPGGQWYYASLCARPWHAEGESVTDPRGWCTLGRETAIQQVGWDDDGWPYVVGGHGGQRYVEAPRDADRAAAAAHGGGDGIVETDGGADAGSNACGSAIIGSAVTGGAVADGAGGGSGEDVAGEGAAAGSAASGKATTGEVAAGGIVDDAADIISAAPVKSGESVQGRISSPPRSHTVVERFDSPHLDGEWNTLRVPFDATMGSVGDGGLELRGQGSLSNLFDLSLVARRWKDFAFDAAVAVRFAPSNYRQMAGLANYYNDLCWSWVFVTWDEVRGCRVIEVAQNDFHDYSSFLKGRAVPVPDEVDTVWLGAVVRTRTYGYSYSFDGTQWHDLGVRLDARVLSDDHVAQRYGGFFTGAFVGMAAVDLSGYDARARFMDFSYTPVDEGH